MSADQNAAVVENLEIDLLLEGMFRAYGVDARRCPRPVVERTVTELIRSMGLGNVSALLERVLHDREEGERAAAALGCCDIGLFSEPGFFRAFKERVVPWLRTYPFVTIWAVQCGAGGDVYSMAILLEEAGLYEKTRIYATEDDAARLGRAAEGLASHACLKFSDAKYRACGGPRSLGDYFEDRGGGRMAARSVLRRNIVWAEYSLATGQSFNEFNLIICRNVIRALTPALQRRVYKLLTESLPVFGLLALDLEESPSISPYVYCYKEWDRAAGLHQRVC